MTRRELCVRFGAAVAALPSLSAKAGRTTLSTRKAQTDEMAARSLSEGDVQTWRVS